MALSIDIIDMVLYGLDPDLCTVFNIPERIKVASDPAKDIDIRRRPAFIALRGGRGTEKDAERVTRGPVSQLARFQLFPTGRIKLY